jgi:argininosuccinate lyase
MESLTSASHSSLLSSPRSPFSSNHVSHKLRPSLIALTYWAKPKPRPIKVEIRCGSGKTMNAGKDKEAKLWGGRFEESVTDAVERFTESISFDKELYKHDIMGSKAHASMLAKQVILFFFFFSFCLFPEKMLDRKKKKIKWK